MNALPCIAPLGCGSGSSWARRHGRWRASHRRRRTARGLEVIRSSRQAMGDREQIGRHDVVVAAVAAAHHAAVGLRRDGVVNAVLWINRLAQRFYMGQQMRQCSGIVRTQFHVAGEGFHVEQR